MSAQSVAAVPLRLASERNTEGEWSHERFEVVVGKDILELLSGSMYLDPITIYREYVQNAADAIDDARELGLLPPGQPGTVTIVLDPATRSVRIRDNGSAIPAADFRRRLTSLGASAKRGTTARGFRGVGRLAGLGYCQELVFRSRAEGEAKVSELRWDCRKLREALRAPQSTGGLVELIRDLVTTRRIAPTSEDGQRFFEVELRGVTRHRSDHLLSAQAIGDYLAQVAPLPFSPEFRFGQEITAALQPHVSLGEIELRVTGIPQPIYRPHRDLLQVEEGKNDAFTDLELVEVPAVDGGLAAVGWILHHGYIGAIPNAALLKGIRLRAGNVQVGDHNLLEELFPEPRFNSWSVGEIHVIDSRIVPNGRRDHFEHTVHLGNLLNHLAPAAREIASRCRKSSIRRKCLREIELQQQAVRQAIEVIAQGSVSKVKRKELALSVEQALVQVTKIADREPIASEGRAEVIGSVRRLRTELSKVMQGKLPAASPLMRLPKAKRAAFEHFFELIYECSANQVAAKALIDRILQRLG